jgi:hypothetical protein
MLVFPKETKLQQKIIEACTAIGGYGGKLQDKFVKGKVDLWLRLPSGNRFAFVEVKLNKYVSSEVITVDFSLPQLEHIQTLAYHEVPVCAMMFVGKKSDKQVKFYFKIAPPLELETKFKIENKIKYTFNEYMYAITLAQSIVHLDSNYERLCFKP